MNPVDPGFSAWIIPPWPLKSPIGDQLDHPTSSPIRPAETDLLDVD
jgi:hypothetical protein